MLKRHVSHIQTADTAAYPINGIDISAHNGNVDLKKQRPPVLASSLSKLRKENRSATRFLSATTGKPPKQGWKSAHTIFPF